MSFPKLSWGREKHDLADRWPKGPDGTPEKPAFLVDSTEEAVSYTHLRSRASTAFRPR